MPRGGKLLVRLRSSDVAMFRFLLESRENEAMFTVLERDPALVKISFYEGSREKVVASLREIGESAPLEILPWPVGSLDATKGEENDP
ncbi:MAG: DUF4911 domain-containing protein [Desulfovibrio sp.]|nr:DUF4911 domain-containing protein [Desulfovibrio sp.]